MPSSTLTHLSTSSFTAWSGYTTTYAMAGTGSVHYDYNAAGLPTYYTDGMGHGFTQSFNALGQVTSLTSSIVDGNHPGTLATNLVYGPTWALTDFDLGNGLKESTATTGCWHRFVAEINLREAPHQR